MDHYDYPRANEVLRSIQNHRAKLNPDYFRGAEEALRAVLGDIEIGMYDPNYLIQPTNIKHGTRIILDHDGVIFDYVTELLNSINRHRGSGYKPEYIKGWGLPGIFQSNEELEEYAIEHPELDWNSIPYHGAVEFANELLKLAREKKIPLIFYSALIYASQHEARSAIIRKFLGHEWENMFKCGVGDKSDLFRPGDIIIDDYPRNLENAKKAGGFPICIARPWNASDSKPSWKGPRYNYRETLEQVKNIIGA